MNDLGSSDEAMLRSNRHPAHRSGGREAMWVLCLVCVPGFIVVVQSSLSGVLFYAAFGGISLVGAILAFLVMNWIGGMEARESASLASEQREERAREKDRAIAEAKARGEFDRWKDVE